MSCVCICMSPLALLLSLFFKLSPSTRCLGVWVVRSVFAVPRLHFSEHRSLSSLQSAGRKSCSFHSADLSELALLQVFHSFPRVSMAPVCWGILKYCPQYIQSCFLIIVLLLLTMFLLFIYHLTALNQSKWHSDDDAVDLTRELMSHSWLAYSLRSSM